ncbi:hypothetical protein H8356DRAFT_1418946 [Neocallimastix lanati (nom. inval.)]|nr:hypothetical protein H8356DRAFT_1418946 [Neocallimastix sp. JGI-2020a]
MFSLFSGHDPTSLYQPDINNIEENKKEENKEEESKKEENEEEENNSSSKDNKQTIKPKYTAELPIITSKFCESLEGNKISCPVCYAIKIHDVFFFGRRAGDKETCSISEYAVDLQPCGTEHPIFEENF